MSELLEDFVNDENEQDDEVINEDEVQADDEVNADQIEDDSIEQNDDTDEQVEDDTDTEVDEDSEPKTVPLTALQEERAKRQELKAELEELRQQQTEQAAAGSTGTAEQVVMAKTLDQGDPDPYSTVTDEDIDMMLPSEKHNLDVSHNAWQQREGQRQSQFNQSQQLNVMEMQARDVYSTEAMGVNRDYDSVVRAGSNFLSPQDKRAVVSDSDPAKKLYDLCIERNPYISANEAGTTETPGSSPQPKKDKAKIPKSSIDTPKLGKVFAEDDSLGSLSDSLLGDGTEEE